MKRSHRQPVSPANTRHRRGAIFAYVMAYVTLSSLLLGLTGTTLHLLMRSSQTDQRLFNDLSRISDVESAMREDAHFAEQITIAADKILISTAAHAITWTVNSNRITREELHGDTRHSLKSITFRKATELTFVTQTESLFVLRITPPAPAAISEGGNTSAATNTPLRAVEIVLPRPATIDSNNNE